MNLPFDLSSDTTRWVIFTITYIGIALGGFPKLVLDRTGVALIGAIAMLVVKEFRVPSMLVKTLASHIDYPTILLLFGLMIFAAQLRVAGFYELAGGYLTRLTDRPKTLLAGLILTSAILSALLANDVVCLAFTPLLCEALLAVRRNPIPYLIALATSSNIGSAATVIGNPQNMYIGSVAHLNFGHYARFMSPIVLVGLVMCWAMVVLLFRGQLKAEFSSANGISARTARAARHEDETLVPSSLPLQTKHPEIDKYLIGKTLVILTGLVFFFLFAHGDSRAVGALAGAGILLCSRRAKAAKLYHLVDWNLLVLFLGLFVVNGEMKELTEAAMRRLSSKGVQLDQPLPLAGVTLAMSNLVSNVPAVMLLTPTMLKANSQQLWYLLALVSTWAGNLTLVGSIANLIVAESAAAYGVKLNLRTYCKVGVPLTLLSVTAGVGWIVLVWR